MLEKSPEAFKTISEAAEELGVEQHVLRFWETKFTQIKPLKRRGGRRYYRPEDMEVLHRIRHLLYQQGFTIKGAKKAMQSKTPAAETAAAVAEVSEVVSQTVSSAKRKTGKVVELPVGQLDLLAAAEPVPATQDTIALINAQSRQALTKVLASLQAARKDLQSAA